MPLVKPAFLLLSVCLLGACSESDDAQGDVKVNAYGEEFIEQGIPASEVADGWEVSFDEFNVTLEDITVGSQQLAGPFTVDVSEVSDGTGQTLGRVTLPEGTYEGQSFTISRVALKGSAEKGGIIKTFDWVFDEPVDYTSCEAKTQVTEDGDATFQITIHADHYLYDSLVSEDPAVKFEALAGADTNGDGDITQAELASTDIGAYDAGNSGVNDLWAWLVAQNATLGHVDGEGHCDASSK